MALVYLCMYTTLPNLYSLAGYVGVISGAEAGGPTEREALCKPLPPLYFRPPTSYQTTG